MTNTLIQLVTKWGIIEFLKPLKNIFDYLEFYYSKILIKRFYRNKQMSVIQIGANDGSKRDHVYEILTSTNYTGVLFEPNPVPFEF